MRYLVTGHTGFKGTWLIRMLAEHGHWVAGLALNPVPGSLFDVVSGERYLVQDHRGDIAEARTVDQALRASSPDVLIHLAAQALVIPSYEDPGTTLRSNVVGTANVLAAARNATTCSVVVVVTTDKVYANDGTPSARIETDPVGGRDPYSASKAMCDLWAQSWARSFDGPKVLIARAGNVIGYGDQAPNRLIPDLLRSWSVGKTALLRHPEAIRPWQHVSDSLRGYLDLVAKAAELDRGSAWNFAPDLKDHLPVGRVAALAAQAFGSGARWSVDVREHEHEEEVLILDSSKARSQLGWAPQYSLEESVQQAVAGRW